MKVERPRVQENPTEASGAKQAVPGAGRPGRRGAAGAAASRLGEAETLAEMSRVITSTRDINGVYERFAALVRALVPADRIVISVQLEDGKSYETAYVSGLAIPGWSAGAVHPAKGTLMGQIALRMKSVLVSDMQRSAFASQYGTTSAVVKAGVRSAIAVPLIFQGAAVGALGVMSTTPGAYTDDQVPTVEKIAAQIAGAVANARLAATMERDAEERQVLAEIGRTVGSSLDIREVFGGFVQQLLKVVPSDRISLITLDPGEQTFLMRCAWGPSLPERQQGKHYPVKGSLASLSSAEQRTILVDDSNFEQVCAQVEQMSRMRDMGFRSLVVTPLITGDRASGALTVSSMRPAAYGRPAVAFLERVALQIAGPVENGVLHDAAKREAGEREVLAEISRVITSTPRIERVYEEFAARVSRLVPFDRITVSLADLTTGLLTRAYISGTDIPEIRTGSSIPLEGSHELETIRHGAGQVKRSNDVGPFPSGPEWLAAGFNSVLIVPMRVGGDPIGTLGLSSKTPDAYSERDVRLIERVASQIAGAVANSRLNSALEREAEERLVLAEMGRVITSTPDVKQVYEAFAAQLARLIKFDRVTVSLIDEVHGSVSRPYVAGKDIAWARPGSLGPFAGSLEEKVVEGRMAVVLGVDDVRGYPNGPLWAQAGFLSLMSTPLVIAGKAIGTLGVSSLLDNAFSARDSALFERVAAQIAGAVAASTLYARAKQDAFERATIAEIGRLVSSTLRIEDVYPLFVQQVIKLIPSDRIVISVLDEEQAFSDDAYMAGAVLPGFPPVGRFPIADTAFEALIATKESILIDAGEMSRLAEAGSASSKNALRTGLQSMLMTPLIWQDKVVGSLNFRSREADPYTPDLIALAKQISAQIAGAVVTSRLYAEARREADTRQALAAIAFAASSDLDLGKAFDAVADELAKLIRSDRMSVTLLDPDTGDLRVAFGRGVQIPGKEPGTLVPAGKDAGWQWRSELDSSLSHHPDSEVLARLGLASRMQVSLGAPASGLAGYLGLWSRTKDAYTPADLDLLQRVAVQITPAIQNAIVHRRSLQLAEAREKAARLEAQTRDLARVNEAKSQFLSTVSHELKTPLTSIMAFTDLISSDREQTLTEKQHHQLEIVRRNARQLSALINDLLDISKIESGKLELLTRPFSLSDLLREVADSFTPVLAAREQKLDLEVSRSDLQVLGDRERVMQVLSNLISNASKYSPEGRPIRLRAEASGDYIAITVKDTGIGISKADQVHLFTPFFRADSSLTRTVSGSGLGLAIVRRIVEMHGGTVSVESDSGAGAEFTVRLPRSGHESDAA